MRGFRRNCSYAHGSRVKMHYPFLLPPCVIDQMKIKCQMCRWNIKPLITVILFKVLFMINPHQERECWFSSVWVAKQTDMPVLLSGGADAFVVWTVGVRLGSHTPLNERTGLYKDEECRMVISFVYILFTSKLPFYRHFTHFSHSEANL